MQALDVAFHAIVPLFFVIIIGQIVRRLGWINDSEVARLSNVIFSTFLPVMLFYNIYVSEFAGAVRASYVFCVVAMVLGAFFLSVLLVLLTEKIGDRRGPMIQAAFRSNIGLLGIPLAQALLPGESMVVTAVVISVVVPINNVLAVTTLEYFRGTKPKIKEILIDILKNPLIIASILGFLTLLFNITLPRVVVLFTDMVNEATTPVLLLLLGASFQKRQLAVYKKELAICVGLRLLIIPAITLSLAAMMGLRDIEFVSLLVLFAAPTGINSFNLVQKIGGDHHLASCAVLTSTALSFFALFFWITLWKYLGMF